MFYVRRDEYDFVAVDDVQASLVAVLLESIFLGIFTLLYTCSSYILVHKGMQLRSRIILLIATTTMYLLSTTSWVVSVLSLLQAVYNPDRYSLTTSDEFMARTKVLSVCLGLNLLFSDAVLLWRTCVLWSEKRIIKIVSCFMLLLVSVFGLVDFCTIFNDLEAPKDARFLNVPTSFSNQYGYVSLFLSLSINILAIALAAIKLWQLKKLTNRFGTRFTSGIRLLSLLVKCGVIYLIIWAAFVSVFISRYHLALNMIIGACASQTTGIYPTLVVVAACLQQLNHNEDVLPTVAPPRPSSPQVLVITKTENAERPESESGHSESDNSSTKEHS